MFRIFDPVSQKSIITGHYPNDGVKATDQVKANAYQGTLTSNLNKDKFIYTSYTSAFFELYTIYKDSVSLVKRSLISFPKYQLTNQSTTPYAQLSRENNYGYTDAYATSKGFYLLYSGRAIREKTTSAVAKALMGTDIFFFDWNGSALSHYQTNIDILNFCVTEDDKTMYAMADLPKPTLVKFKLF